MKEFKNSEKISFLVSNLFFFLSTAYVYIYWVHAEIYNMFLIMLGFFMWFMYLKNMDVHVRNTFNPSIYLYLSAIIFGLATFAKTPNLVGILPLVICEAWFRRGKNLLVVLFLFGFTTFILYIIFYITTGNISPYTVQYFYCGNYPFWNGYGPEDVGGIPLSEGLFKLSILSLSGLRTILYNLFYYIFGRFTGIIWYYPFILLSIFSYIGFIGKYKDSYSSHENLDLGRALILLVIILNVFMYLYLAYDSPFNYFGGGHAVGNRYFYIYPAFLFLIGKVELNKKTLGILSFVLLTSLAFVGPMNLSPIEASAEPMEHTTHLPYKILPLEYTLLDDSLPLWNPPITRLNNDMFYFPMSNVILDENILIIEGSYPELLFKSSLKKSYNIHLLNPVGDKIIILRSGEFKKVIILNASQQMLVEMPIEPVFKINDNEYLYKLAIDLTPIQSLDEHIIIRFVDLSESEKFYYLDGWHGLEDWGGTPTRWMSDDATFMIYTDENRTADLSLQAFSFYRPRTLEIYVNDLPHIWAEVPAEGFVMVKVPISLNEGANLVRFHVPVGCERPCDIPELKNKDGRDLCLAIQNITLT